MSKTQLPTIIDYENAIDELKQLNEELFYDDFKEKIKDLQSNLEQLAFSNSNDFKKEAETVINRATLLYRQIEDQQVKMSTLLEQQQNAITNKNSDFLNSQREQLLFIYEELQKSTNLFTDRTQNLQQQVERMISQALKSISSVSESVKEFTQKLFESDTRNRELLEQNKMYVSVIKEHLSDTEQKVNNNILALQQMAERWDKLSKSYEEKFLQHEKNLKNTLVIREDALMNRMTSQHSEWLAKLADQDKEQKLEVLNWQEDIKDLLKKQNEQNETALKSISTNMSSKEDLAAVERKNSLKTNILLSVVAIETVLIGIQFFI